MPREIADGVYDITVRQTEGRRYRVFLFDGDVPTLVDTGYDEDVDALFEAIDELGIDPERLIITHGHPDHMGGFDSVVDRYEPETWVPRQTDTETQRKPDHRYEDGDRVGPFTAVHVPGHTSDSYALVDEEAGIAVLGDALWGADWRGLPAGYFALPSVAYSESLNEAEESLEKLLAYDFDIGLVYHGTTVTERASEKIGNYYNFPERPS